MKRFLLILLFPFYVAAQTGTHLHLIATMLDSIKAVKTLRVKISATEKVGNGYLTAISENKLEIKPRKLYFINRQKKLEILYKEGESNSKAVVKPHVFPYISMSLNPNGSLMRKNQHYTIHELGYEYIGKSIAIALSKEKEKFAQCVTYYGKHERNGYKCHLFVYETPRFPYIDYVVKEKETLTSIALKLNLNDYMLRLKNKLENEFDFLEPGSILKVPLYYCKKAVFFIDEKSMLPINVSLFDDTGLLESYDFSEITVNKPFDPAEFTKGYKDYHF